MKTYGEKMLPILEDLENHDIELAGGSTVGMILSITDSLLIYICNKTIGKKKYENVQDEVIEIKNEAQNLRKRAIEIVDEDRNVLKKILEAYRNIKQNAEMYDEVCKESVKFCIETMEEGIKTLNLSKKLEKVGNKMLESDFKICKKYANAAIAASIENIEINLKSVSDEKFKNEARKEYIKNKNTME